MSPNLNSMKVGEGLEWIGFGEGNRKGIGRNPDGQDTPEEDPGPPPDDGGIKLILNDGFPPV